MLNLPFIILLVAITFDLSAYELIHHRTKQTKILSEDLERYIPEISGLTITKSTYESGCSLWGHNDSGHLAEVYKLSPLGKVELILELPVQFNDIEDIDAAPCPWSSDKMRKECIWLADVGDNLHHREQVSIIVFEAPGVEQVDQGLQSPFRQKVHPQSIATFTLSYPKGLRPNVEAFAVTPSGDGIALIEKTDQEEIKVWGASVEPILPGEIKGMSIKAYQPLIADKMSLGLRSSLDRRAHRVTGADFNDRGDTLFIRTYSGIWRYRGEGVGLSLVKTLNTLEPELIHLTLDEPQGEAVAFDPDRWGIWTGSEKKGSSKASLNFYSNVF